MRRPEDVAPVQGAVAAGEWFNMYLKRENVINGRRFGVAKDRVQNCEAPPYCARVLMGRRRGAEYGRRK